MATNDLEKLKEVSNHDFFVTSQLRKPFYEIRAKIDELQKELYSIEQLYVQTFNDINSLVHDIITNYGKIQNPK